MKLESFTPESLVTAKKCTKKCECDARAKFASIKREPITFLPISLSLLSSLLKLPIASNLLPQTHDIMKALKPIMYCMSEFSVPKFPINFQLTTPFFFFFGGQALGKVDDRKLLN